MSDVRRLMREKTERAKGHKKEQLKENTTVATPVDTTVATPVDTTVITPPPSVTPDINEATADAPLQTGELAAKLAQPQYLDATHTASEQRVYSVMYRETISKGVRERHYGPKELCIKTGIRSDRTVRMAVRGLIQKLSLEVVSHGFYFPQGPRYRVYEPKDVIKRRKAAGLEIDPQTKKIIGTTVDTTVDTVVSAPVDTPVDGTTKIYSSTPVEITGVTPVEITGVYKYEKNIGDRVIPPTSSSNVLERRTGDDDEAFAEFTKVLREVAREVTGKETSATEAGRWRELAEVLAAELKIASARTSVSSVPAFLAEHLRRRLWKIDKKQAQAEGRELPDQSSGEGGNANPVECPDCRGSGWWYPEGVERGVAKCKHASLPGTKGV
ncbi:MAG TPA: hypothetical protein VGV59_16755 [Pyrinomonadaceae bacterium]|nr:hypothetical protein [Pyrinomonadaceae bacterium]